MVDLLLNRAWILALALALSGGATAAEVDSTPTLRTILLVRHAEKCHLSGDDPALSSAGSQRAQALARALHDVRVDAIYSTPFRRTVDTVAPLAEERGLQIRKTPVKEGFLDDLAVRLFESEDRVVLVSGHSNTIPTLVNLLAGTDYADLADDDYDKLFVVTLAADNTARVLILRYGGPVETEPGC